MKEKIFTGSGVALITPFTENRGVDYTKLGEMIDFQIAEGTDAIVICATTGEASTMPDSEHLSVIEFTTDKVAKRVPVIAGAGSNDTYHAVELSKQSIALGADAILSVTPYYNKTTQKGLIAHFSAIADSIDAPVIVYNVPSRTNLNIDPSTLEELCKIPNINAIKECNLLQVPEIKARCGDELNLYSGEDGQICFMLSAGGIGVISVMANILPKYTHEIAAKFLAGDQKGSWDMQIKAIDLIKTLFCEVNPMPVKEACNLLGMDVGICRLPLVTLTAANRERLRNAMIDFGLKV